MDAYERLSNTTDARGRKLEIFKLNRPPPMFRTFKEASGFKASPFHAPCFICIACCYCPHRRCADHEVEQHLSSWG